MKLGMGLAVLLGFLPLACDRHSNQVLIGGVATLTGEGASYGLAHRQGYEMAVEEWNARGGVLGKAIRLDMADDRGDPAQGAAACKRLIEQGKVAGLVGAGLSRVTLAGAPVAQAAGIPMVTPASTHPRITEVGDCIFRACYNDAFQGAAGARFAHGHLKARKAACLFDQGNEYTRGLAEVFRDRFTGFGGRVVAYEGHPSGAADFRAELARILAAGPEVLYVPDYFGDAGLIARQARELGFKGPLLGADGWDAPQLVEWGGWALENSFFTSHFTPEDPDPVVQTFVRQFKARYGVLPDGQAALGYDAAVLLLDAIRRADSTDGKAVRKALTLTDRRMVTGRVRFDAGRNPVKPFVVMEVKGGKVARRTSMVL